MKIPNFQVGDCVVLKHDGGPTMTVESFAELSDGVNVFWFSAKGEVQHDQFPRECLKLFEKRRMIPSEKPCEARSQSIVRRLFGRFIRMTSSVFIAAVIAL